MVKEWWDGLVFNDGNLDDPQPLHFTSEDADALIAQLNPGTAVKEPDGLGGYTVRLQA